MTADISRRRDDPLLDFFSVEMQQGRVLLDSDWNELAAIIDRRLRAGAGDILGPATVSSLTPDAFKIVGDGGQFTIGRGRMYVDGLLAENHGLGDFEFDKVLAEERRTEDTLNYDEQPYWPTPEAYTGSLTHPFTGRRLVYLDVWHRDVTYLEHPALVEPAVGVDATTRRQTAWQVRVSDVTTATCDAQVDALLPPPSAGRLTTDTVPVPPTVEPCDLPPTGGYRGPENQLYRIEIHRGGGLWNGTDDLATADVALFKWSRNNAAIGSRVTEVISGTKLRLATLGRDALLRFNTDDWVEITDDRREFGQQTGEMRRIDVDPDEQTITFTPPLPANLIPADANDLAKRHLRVRRWDQKGEIRAADGTVLADLDASGATGLIPVRGSSVQVVLENGIVVEFSLATATGQFRAGDYWLFAARTADTSFEKLDDAPPRGVHHHYAKLAFVDFDTNEETDCRNLWPPKSGSCCTLRVAPGEDIQQAINSVIAQGGGCICLAKGMHEVHGPLTIQHATALSLHGEGDATLLRVVGTDAAGQGGLIITQSQDIALERMVITGESVPAVISISDLAGEPEANKNVTLRDVTVVNVSESPIGEFAGNCAVRMAEASDIALEHCRLIGEMGLTAMFAQSFPMQFETTAMSADVGSGVAGLRLQNCSVRFRSYGVWSLAADRWQLNTCDIGAMGATELGVLSDILTADLTTVQRLQDLVEQIEELTKPSNILDTGTALSAFRWRDCAIRECQLTGARGLELWWWLRGTVADNEIAASAGAVHAAWIHDAQLVGNRITCSAGAALSLAGGYRPVVARNHVRASVGLTNRNWDDEVTRLLNYVTEVAQVYSRATSTTSASLLESIVFWILLRAILKFIELDDIVRAAIKLTEPNDTLVDLNYFFLATFLLDSLRNRTSPINVPAPLIALRLEHNDIESTTDGVALRDIFPLGGFGVVNNRLHARTGQALQINAAPLATNLHLFNLLFRVVFKALIEDVLPALLTAAASADPDPTPVLDLLLNRLKNWSARSESFMGADCRIDENTIHSIAAAVESNLWELSVHENHITIREQSLSIPDAGFATIALNANSDTRPIALAIYDGSPVALRAALAALLEDDLLTNTGRRAAAAGAFVKVASGVANVKVKTAASDLATAISNGNAGTVESLLAPMFGLLAGFASSYGIAVGNPGCRIEHNHVLVPPDADLETWGRGGILIATAGGKNADATMLLILILELLGIVGAATGQIGITETLVSDNEIVGGYGHGVHVHAPITVGSFQLGLINLNIAGNQIRAMGGAGIRLEPDTQAVGVDIADNTIENCSSIGGYVAGLTYDKGGIAIDNAGMCRIRGNRINYCGSLPGVSGVYGIDIEGVFGLELDGNELLENGSDLSSFATGGIKLTDIYGEVAIRDNRVLYHQGLSLNWSNTAQSSGDIALTEELLLTVAFYLHSFDAANLAVLIADAHSVRAVVDANAFKVKAASEVPAFHMLNIGELLFTGNSATNQAKTTQVGKISQVARCVLSNNMLTSGAPSSLVLCKIAAGVISSNVCSSPIQLFFSPGAQDGLNTPPVSRILS